MEYEGRLFGNLVALEEDVLRYNERLDDIILLGAIRPAISREGYQRMQFTDGKIAWVLIEDHKDFQKIMGMEFSQMMFDVSFPHDCLSYCLSRLRSPARGACRMCGLVKDHKMSCPAR